MSRAKGFSLPAALFLATLIIGGGTAVYYFKDPIISKYNDLRQGSRNDSVAQLSVPSDTPTPTPTPVSTPSTRPTSSSAANNIGSIADLSPDPNNPSTSSLPGSGPELNLAVLVAGGTASGGTMYYLNIKKKLKKNLKNINIV